jgi:iron complex transport system substrate-binding protein
LHTKLAKKTICALLGIILVLIMPVGTGAYPLQLEDQFGRSLTLERPPMRIISGSPGNTEILFALGLEDRIVGVTDWCDYPVEAKAKPKIGDIAPLNIERVISLQPDLVLACNLNGKEPVESLTALGIPTFALNPVSFADLGAAIRLVGQLTGTETAAAKLAMELDTALATLALDRESAGPKPKVLIAIGTDLSDLWTAGTGTFLDEAVTGLGWENIAGGLGFSWGQISLEYILAENPEVILTEMDPAVFQDDAFFKDLTAVRQDQVFQIDVDLLSRPGPRLIQALKDLAFLRERIR